MRRVLAAATMLGMLGTAAPAQTTTRVSIASDGTQGNSHSDRPSISANGRFVAFHSSASNLVPDDTNTASDVFVHDRQTGETWRVSVATDGTQANGGSSSSSISADGRFVAFESGANTLVAGDTNAAPDIFVHDRKTGQTTRVSVSSGGVQGNFESLAPSISADGRFVAFWSSAANLVPSDTNATADVFVHDRETGQTTRVSVSSAGAQGNGASTYPSLSGDGRYVAFESSASGLVIGDTNGRRDIFVHDRQTAQTTRVSVATGGAQGNMESRYPSISADGRFVAFESLASNLVAGDSNGTSDVFVHDRQTGETSRVSVSTGGVQGLSSSILASISGEGRFVAFQSVSPNLVPGDTNSRTDIFLRDRLTNQTARVSVASDGTQGDSDSLEPAVSADGRFVAFHSAATNLVPDDTNGVRDVFVRERVPPPSCPGDANGDGMVDFGDITSVLANFGNNYSPGTGPGDADADGIVAFSDVTTVLASFGTSCR